MSEADKPEDPAAQSARITTFFKGVGSDMPCPSCRHLTWILLDRPDARIVLPFVHHSGSPIAGHHGLYTLACTRCGFVRQHHKAAVDRGVAAALADVTGDVESKP